jgi:hypothetical protein
MKELEIKQDIPLERQYEAILFSYQFFSHTMKFNDFNRYLKNETLWDISWYLVDETDEILGIYLMGGKHIPFDDGRFADLLGVEGLLLAVDESIRGFGFGNRLKDLPRTLGVDYIWGQQFKLLNNLDDWLKRRELIGEIGDVYITAEIF